MPTLTWHLAGCVEAVAAGELAAAAAALLRNHMAVAADAASADSPAVVASAVKDAELSSDMQLS